MTLGFCILGWVLFCIALYAVINLTSKCEKLEEMNMIKDDYVNKLSVAIHMASEKLKEIDQKETFKGDDEVGWFFKNILYIQETLNEFNLNKDGSNTQPTNKS